MKYIECKICNKNIDKNKLGNHIRFTHKLKAKEYYDKYCNIGDEELCVVCGNTCKFITAASGYQTTCSSKCAQLNPDTRAKIKSTNIKRYGVDVPSKNKTIQSKAVATNIKRYGTKTPYQNESIKQKGINTTLNRYGVENAFQSHDVQTLSRETMREKYGVELNILRPEIKTHIMRSRRKNKYNEFISRLSLKNIEYLDNEDKYINYDGIRNYKCKLCGKLFTEESTQAYDVQCGCLRNTSKAEHEICDWLKTYNFTPLQSQWIKDDIGRLELDIVIELPNKKIAIEFCGLYWHSELYRPNNYHKRKLEAANANGYTLIQVFEDEWNYKQSIVKSIILQHLNANKTVIYGRKCTIISFDKTPRDFLDTNHIQGACNGKYSYGLEYNNEIVAACIFSKSRFKDEWECLRYCNKLNVTVIGGFSKLLKKFINEVDPKSIVSYADLRYFTGDMYLQNGFNKEPHRPVGYYYCPKGFREKLNRMKFQKHKLVNMKSYDQSKTEVQIMTEEGYTRIFDAGQGVYRRKLHI